MNMVSRLLSLIVCLQLAVSCGPSPLKVTFNDISPTENNSGSGNSGSSSGSGSGSSSGGSGVPEEETITINGLISAVKAVSDFIFPSAMAAEGTLKVFDLSDPLDPKELASRDITGTDAFSISLSKEMIQGKLIKLNFVSSEGVVKNRDQIFTIDEGQETASAELNQDNAIIAKVIEDYLNYQLIALNAQLEDVLPKVQARLQRDFNEYFEILDTKENMLNYLYSVSRDRTPIAELSTRDFEDEDWNYFYNEVGNVFSDANLLGVVPATISKCTETEIKLQSVEEHVLIHRDLSSGSVKYFDLGVSSNPSEILRILNETQNALRDQAISNGQNLEADFIIRPSQDPQNQISCTIRAFPVADSSLGAPYSQSEVIQHIFLNGQDPTVYPNELDALDWLISIFEPARISDSIYSSISDYSLKKEIIGQEFNVAAREFDRIILSTYRHYKPMKKEYKGVDISHIELDYNLHIPLSFDQLTNDNYLDLIEASTQGARENFEQRLMTETSDGQGINAEFMPEVDAMLTSMRQHRIFLAQKYLSLFPPE